MIGYDLFDRVPDTYKPEGYRLLTNFNKESLEIYKTAIQVYRILFDTCDGLKIDKASNEHCDYGLWILDEQILVDLSRYWDIVKKLDRYWDIVKKLESMKLTKNNEESNNG